MKLHAASPEVIYCRLMFHVGASRNTQRKAFFLFSFFQGVKSNC